MTIKDLKEFINRHELDDDTIINISKYPEVINVYSFSIITKLNGKPIKHRLLITNEKQ